jgi:tRNA (guanine-N7-)-methyltransferase
MYQQLLNPEGEIHFKTDNDRLFEFSLEEFEAVGLRICNVTEDLHSSRWDADNIRTEFEEKYAEQKIRIKRAEASKEILY